MAKTNKEKQIRRKPNAKSVLLRIKEKAKMLLVCNERSLRREVIVAISLYVFILIWGLCFKFGSALMIERNYINLSELDLQERFLYDIVPFRTRQNHVVQWIEFFANSLVFAPFGVLLNYLFHKRNILRDFALCLGLSLSIEVFQLFTLLGGFATVDLIMNSLGYFVGLGLYFLIFKKRTVKTCVWICRVANLIFLVLSVYAIATLLQNGKLITAILTHTL
jgi:glycopeptide antibiotics resistance protein